MYFELDPLLVNFTDKINALNLNPGQWWLISQGVVFCWSLGVLLTIFVSSPMHLKDVYYVLSKIVTVSIIFLEMDIDVFIS